MTKLLLIDDDKGLSQLLCEYLTEESFTIDTAFTGHHGLEKSLTNDYDLIILDIMLPGMTGLELLKNLRAKGSVTPVLMLTAKGDDIDRILGLELGADDYLPKPCNPRELTARIRAILRRVQPLEHSSSSKVNIISARMEAWYDKEELHLTGAEFKILEQLHVHSGEIVTKEQLSESALGRALTRYDRSIDVHVSNLRKKLVLAGASEDIIANQRGAGYLLKPDEVQ